METLNGQNIVSLQTLDSMYGSGFLNVHTDTGETHRLHISEILPLLQDQTFKLEKKRTYKHLKRIDHE